MVNTRESSASESNIMCVYFNDLLEAYPKFSNSQLQYKNDIVVLYLCMTVIKLTKLHI
uniref:Uncharacterized protein n=1 Tax=viral metagenome TaxID=1070528 RepID=A0A6C0H6N4_9ZZZZ